MASRKKRIRIIIILFLLIVYFFIAARPIPRETILTPGWIISLEKIKSDINGQDSEHSAEITEQNPILINNIKHSSGQLFPFTLGDYFGYIDSTGYLALNKTKENNIYLGKNMWTEYAAEPANIEVKNITGNTIVNIGNTEGYPVLLDNRIFILGSEMNSLSEIGTNGGILWTYEFGAPLTCIDVAAGLVVTGSLDGIVEILDSNGKRVYFFQPGGSQWEIIMGCAISENGSRIGIICGIEPQRFLLLERLYNTANEFRIIYHEFLETGFRRPVHISFIDDDSKIIYERVGGLNCYNIRSRNGVFIPFDGNITAIDNSGYNGFLFLITSHSMQYNELIGIKIPADRRFSIPELDNARNMIFIKAAFKSRDVFLGRSNSMLIAGGGKTLISFELEEK